MTQRNHVALLATLMSVCAWGQEVSLYSTTLAQVWKQETPGFDKATFTPATQYLGIDATRLGSDNLSLHLFGWGRTDLGDASAFDGSKFGGYLSYGYLRYRFDQANADVKAGRFSINQGVAVEQVDGLSARVDLRGGFTVSAFGGKPVLFKTVDPRNQKDYETQRNFIFGTRFSWRSLKVGEVGLSYLQDGTQAGQGPSIPPVSDYTRQQVGADIRIAPLSFFDLSGRTVFDVAGHSATPTGTAHPSRIAEQDYTLTVKVAEQLAVSGSFTEQNFQAYFRGTTFQSLFRQVERDKNRAWGGRVAWGEATSLQLLVDYRQIHRETYGDATRYGLETRWSMDESNFLAGVGFHRVDAEQAAIASGTVPTFSLSHGEARAWVMFNGSMFMSSLDGIYRSFDDKKNPYLNGRGSEYEMVASIGIQATKNLKLSGDVSYGANPLYNREVRGLLRAEFRFGLANKGGH